MKRLYRSRKHKSVSGVFGGLAEMYDVDPTIVRLAFVFITLATGVLPALIFYIIAALIIPLEPKPKKA